MHCIQRDNRKIYVANNHQQYIADIEDAFDYYFNCTETHSEDGFLIADFSVPAYHKVIGFNDFKVHFHSFPESIGTINMYLDALQIKENMTILDLGSYSGFTSIMFSKEMNGTGNIIAVEPDVLNIESIKINLDRYPIKNIILEESAMYSKDTTLQFSSEGNQGSYLEDIWGFNRGNIIDVNAITLSTLANKHNLSKVDLIKCDIEGSEKYIFNDLDFFTKFKPTIVIELHDINIETIMSSLRQFNYLAEKIFINIPEIERFEMYKIYIPE